MRLPGARRPVAALPGGGHPRPRARRERQEAGGSRFAYTELEILGYRKEEIIGQHCAKFVVMHEASDRAATKKLSGEGLKPFVRAFLRADGTSVMVALVERYLRDAKGAIVGIRTALTPIHI